MTFQMMGINREIVLGKKTCRAVIAPLDNMREQATRSQARTAGQVIAWAHRIRYHGCFTPHDALHRPPDDKSGP